MPLANFVARKKSETKDTPGLAFGMVRRGIIKVMNDELSDEIFTQIESLCDAGNVAMDDGDYEEALNRFLAAWELLPEPRSRWGASTWILSSIADAHFFQDDFAAMRDPLMLAMQEDAARANPFLRLRLGQCLFELDEPAEAANWLAGAYLQEGFKLFEDEDPKYLDFIKSQLEPPEGGWPEGW
ncbi:MAG: tetratricopeptide repeat protein [Planctomycetaceae bacterium]